MSDIPTDPMTLSQALRLAKRLRGKISILQSRASASVSHKSEDTPAFSFQAVMEELVSARLDLVILESRIGVTNAVTKVEYEGRKLPILMAVRELQETKAYIAFLNALPVRAQAETSDETQTYVGDGVYRASKVPWKCHLPESLRVQAVDKAQATFDRVNDAVESANHVTQLVQI